MRIISDRARDIVPGVGPEKESRSHQEEDADVKKGAQLIESESAVVEISPEGKALSKKKSDKCC